MNYEGYRIYFVNSVLSKFVLLNNTENGSDDIALVSW